jgi:hypothetical protein
MRELETASCLEGFVCARLVYFPGRWKTGVLLDRALIMTDRETSFISEAAS